MKAYRRIARNMRRLRVEADLSQENLAVDSNVDRTYISRLERGTVNPTVSVLEDIASALGVDIVDLLHDLPSNTPLPEKLARRRPKLPRPRAKRLQKSSD